MKKFLFAFTIGFTSVVALSTCAYSQNSVMPVAFNDAKKFNSSIRNMADMVSRASLSTRVPDEKSTNAKAIRDFRNRYKAVDNVNWFSDPNGIVFYFVQDGFGNRVFYDKKGHWQSSLILYSEDKLPKDIRASVKSVYYDFAITVVQEVQTLDGMVYIVNLEDKTNIKVLRVNTLGETEILSEMTKG